jgi:predicted nucleic acid-binding protein
MPEPGSHGLQRQYVLDAGALIACERQDRRVAALFAVAAEHRIEMILPSAILAQVWRGGPRQANLGRALRNPGLVEAPLDHADAREVGRLLADSCTSDVVDAHVAVLAKRLRAPVITSDPHDIATLDDTLVLVDV